MPTKTKILLVDDHHLFNDGIMSLLQNEADFEVVGQVFEGNQVLISILKNSPNLVLLDANLPNRNGKELAEAIRRDFPNVKIVILTMYDESQLVKEFKKLGVDGYILKNSTKNELLEGIRTVIEGQPFFDPKLSENSQQPTLVDDEFIKKFSLTPREIEMIRMIRDGLSSQDIADKSNLSLLTVKTHRRNIHFKLKTETTADLIRFANENGI
ncbi:response regulator [Emticicia aquatilis]|nr:response regulator transcription factor [Emticicia aquatilis]